MTLDTQTQFSIAEKEEIVAEARVKLAKALGTYELAQIAAKEADSEAQQAWNAYMELQDEYEKLDRALIEALRDAQS